VTSQGFAPANRNTELELTSRKGHVRYINILTWHRGLRVKIAVFLTVVAFVSQFPRETWRKKTAPNIDVCPENLGAMLEY